jgi:hypothetical protein
MGLTGPKPRTIEEIIEVLRLNSTYRPSTDCYLWQGRTIGEGYGSICYNGKGTYIHRLIYEYVFGEDALVVRHTCDTPNCWNPDHLQNGSHANNVEDKVAKLRHSFGVRRYNAKLDDEMVRKIRASQSTAPELAKEYGVHRAVIHDILKGKTWKHVQ